MYLCVCALFHAMVRGSGVGGAGDEEGEGVEEVEGVEGVEEDGGVDWG